MISSIQGYISAKFEAFCSFCSRILSSVRSVANRVFGQRQTDRHAPSLEGRLEPQATLATFNGSRLELDEILKKEIFILEVKKDEAKAKFKQFVLAFKPGLAEGLLLCPKTAFVKDEIPSVFDELLKAHPEEGFRNEAYRDMFNYLVCLQDKKDISERQLEKALIKARSSKDLLFFDCMMKSKAMKQVASPAQKISACVTAMRSVFEKCDQSFRDSLNDEETRILGNINSFTVADPHWKGK